MCKRNARLRTELPNVLSENVKRSTSKISKPRLRRSAKLKNRTSMRMVYSVHKSSVFNPNSASTRRECPMLVEALPHTHPPQLLALHREATAILKPTSSSTSPSSVRFLATNFSATTSNLAAKRSSAHLPFLLPLCRDRTAWVETQALEPKPVTIR